MPKKLILLLAGMFILQGLGFAEEVQIKQIEMKRDRGFDYLDIYTSGYVEGKSLLLEDRLVIDFPNTKIAKDFEISKRKSTRIQEISAEIVGETTARIIVTLKKEIDYEIVNVYGQNKSVVEISDRIDMGEKIMATWETRNLKEKGEKIKAVEYKPDPKIKNLPLRGQKIVIDPGHGGRDPGSFSRSGIPEKLLTLQTARAAASFLKDAGATVFLTRNSDRKYNLKDIVDYTNQIQADIFISIHYNYSTMRSISGTETYFYTNQSRNLALAIHQSLISGIKRKDRGLRHAMFYVCHHTEMPSVLIEPAYLSDPDEDELAREPKFQTEIAQNILEGVLNYFRSKQH